MPTKPGRLCPEPGCGRKSVPGSHYCATHKAQADARRAERVRDSHKEYNAGRDENDAFYRTERWKRLSAYYRRMHPLCEECEKAGRVEPARLTDHIKARRTHPELSLEWSNLRALCWPCHNRLGEKVGRTSKP